MTHDELEAIRLLATNSWGVSPVHVHDLLTYIAELHSIVHDLRQEPGYALGRQDVLREVLDVLGKVPVTWDADHTKAVADPQTLAIALDVIECLGPVAPHLAPDDLRRENEALRAALAAVVKRYPEGLGPAQAEEAWREHCRAVAVARQLLDHV